MTYEDWKRHIINVTRAISDEEYQRRTWFGADSEISSPDEMICNVFDDYLLPEFIREHRHRLTESELLSAERFLAAMEQFADSTPKHLDPDTVFRDERWQRIRTLAREMLVAWSGS